MASDNENERVKGFLKSFMPEKTKNQETPSKITVKGGGDYIAETNITA